MTRGVERTSLPAFVKPQLAAVAKKAPDGPDWLHEIKLDGYKRRPTVSLLLLEAGDSENASSAAARGQ
jgi:hypothetical protein